METIRDVVANHACTNCGTCVGMCPTDALQMAETPAGLMRPELDDERCNDCGLCHSVCPQIQMPQSMRPNLANPYIGPIRGAYLAQATEADIRFEAQTGGLVRALAAWMLETGRAEAVLCVMDNPQEPFRPLPTLLTEPEHVLRASRSKYCPAPINTLIRDMRAFDGRIVYVGLGCSMQGLELAMCRAPRLREKIVLRIGLFCAGILSFAAAAYLVRCTRLRREDVSTFDYRHKARRGWPGDPRLVSRDGLTQFLSAWRRMHARHFFTPIACQLCIDRFNGLADIAVGDPFGLAHGPDVPSAAIVRTKVGDQYLHEARQSGAITTKGSDPAEVARFQRAHRWVNDRLTCGREMLRRGYELPVSLRTPPIEVSKIGRRPLWAQFAIWIGLFSGTPRGVRWLWRLPTWLPMLCHFYRTLERLPMRIMRRLARTLRRLTHAE